MQPEKITLTQLEQLTGFNSATIQYLSPFGDMLDLEIILQYGTEKRAYTLELTPEGLSKFSEWAARAVAG